MAEKRRDICLSSELEEEEDEYNEVDDEETSSQSCSDEGSDWNYEEEADLESFTDRYDDNEGGSESTKVLDIESCNRIIHLLEGGSDLKELKVVECKAYLRKYGLRLTGNKAVCLQRIKEHWRMKDGKGEELYPRSSFVINCTGDACTGDVVLFTQRVHHERCDKMKTNGNLLGKRTIVGRIVKESYGAAKQQHTFTVEVLWSNGFKRLPPMFPLLVKGRNLYRMRTFRQRWDDEEERSKVLAEKHSRGTEARRVRAMRTARSANQGSKQGKQSYRARHATNANRGPHHKARSASDAPFRDRTNQMLVPVVTHQGYNNQSNHGTHQGYNNQSNHQGYSNQSNHGFCYGNQGRSLHPNHGFHAYPAPAFQGGSFHPNYGFQAYQSHKSFWRRRPES